MADIFISRSNKETEFAAVRRRAHQARAAEPVLVLRQAQHPSGQRGQERPREELRRRSCRVVRPCSAATGSVRHGATLISPTAELSRSPLTLAHPRSIPVFYSSTPWSSSHRPSLSGWPTILAAPPQSWFRNCQEALAGYFHALARICSVLRQ